MDKKDLKIWAEENIKDIEHYIRSFGDKGCSSFYLGKLNISFSDYRTTSYGGLYKIDGIWVPGIDISLRSCINTSSLIFRFYEYPSYDHNPIIGGFFTDNPKQKALAIICHEMSHAVQRWVEYYNKTSKSKPHGILFKYFYKNLRQKYVNPYLQNQIIMSDKYKSQT